MGRYLGWAGKRIRRAVAAEPARPDYGAFISGALYWVAGAVVVTTLACWLQFTLLGLADRHPYFGIPVAVILLGLALKPLLAWRMLKTEVQAVEEALARSLDAGRERLAYLVSRDVTHLSECEVRESAIESLAENLNDSVVAPVFWFALLGLPGAALYRFANTADAMWGYPGMRGGRNWQWAGKWAARAEDVLSWVPARITAALLISLGRYVDWGSLRTEAARTPSPNSGWPMAAMALRLGVRLRKPGVYALNEDARPPAQSDTARAIGMGDLVVLSSTALAAAPLAAMHWLASVIP